MNNVAEIYKNKERDVFKFVHLDGAETTIKLSPSSCVTDKHVRIFDRDKVAVFLSLSVGCPLKCRFCYLTVKKYPYSPISDDEVIKNTIHAIEYLDLRDKYLKLSFMGMGDAFIAKNDIVKIATKIILHCLQYDLIKGVDGVDVGTSFPIMSDMDYDKLAEMLGILNNWLMNSNIPLNPYHTYVAKSHSISPIDRTPLRLFISLHSLKDDVRQDIMPQTNTLSSILQFAFTAKVNVIFHYLLFKDVNDADIDIYLLRTFFKGIFKNFQLRLLRFNKCEGSTYVESDKFDAIVNQIYHSDISFKYQISPGDEIKAACGQFICTKLKE